MRESTLLREFFKLVSMPLKRNIMMLKFPSSVLLNTLVSLKLQPKILVNKHFHSFWML